MAFQLTGFRFRAIASTAFVFLFIFAFGLWSNPSLNPTYYPDSPEYIQLARDFSSPVARDRPPGYSLLIRLAMVVSTDGWPKLVVFLQLALLAFLGALVQRTCVSWWHLRTSSAVAIALMIGCEPTLVLNTSLIMADLPLAVCLTGTVLLVLRAFTRPEGTSSFAGRRDVVLAGLLSGYAALVKPQWLPGIALLVAGVILLDVRSWRKRVKPLTILVGIQGAVCGLWLLFLWIDFRQAEYSRLGAGCLNMIALRNGDAKYAEGTPLYQYLSHAGILPQALALRWDTVEEYSKLKDLIPMEERCRDRVFWRKGFAVDGLAIVERQISRWPRIFTNRPYGPSADAFPGMPHFVRYVYGAVYDWFWRPMAGVLLLFALLWRRAATALRQFVIFSSVVVAGMSITLVALSYQEFLITRFRICLVPLMMTLACAPALAFAESVWSRVRRPRPRE